MVEKTSGDVDGAEFDAFLNALKETNFDAEAGSKAYHHSAVDPAEWRMIIARLRSDEEQRKS